MDIHNDRGRDRNGHSCAHVDVGGNHLSVSAESKQSEEFDEKGFAVRERYFGKLSRTLQLAFGVKVC